MNKKKFIGFSVVIDLLVLILLIAAIAENGNGGNKGSKKAEVVAENTESSSSKSSSKGKNGAGNSTDDSSAGDNGTGSSSDNDSSAGNNGAENSSDNNSSDGKNGTGTSSNNSSSDGNNGTENSSDNNSSTGNNGTGGSSSSNGTGNLTVTVRFDGMAANANAVQGIFDVKNNGGAVSLSDLTTGFFLTSEGKSLVFECYHAAVNTAAGAYQALNSVSGSFESAGGQNTDTKLTIKYGDSLTLNTGDTMTVNFSIHSGDWSNMITNNDWSTESADHIVFYKAGAVIAGTEPQ